MTVTVASDLFQPEVVADAVQAAIAEGLPVFQGNPAAIVQGGMPAPPNGLGAQITIPYFASLGEWEETADGTALTPAQLTQSEEVATITHGGKAVEITKWALANGTDPNTAISTACIGGMTRYIESKLLVAAQANVATEWDAYTHDVSGGATITYDAIVEAMALFGDESDDLVGLAMHSKVAKDLRLLKGTDGLPIFTDAVAGGLPRVLGIPVIISNKLAPVSTVYKTLLLRRGALVSWIADISDGDVQADHNILTNTDVFAIHAYMACHRYLHLNGRTYPGVVHLLTD